MLDNRPQGRYETPEVGVDLRSFHGRSIADAALGGIRASHFINPTCAFRILQLPTQEQKSSEFKTPMQGYSYGSDVVNHLAFHWIDRTYDIHPRWLRGPHIQVCRLVRVRVIPHVFMHEL